MQLNQSRIYVIPYCCWCKAGFVIIHFNYREGLSSHWDATEISSTRFVWRYSTMMNSFVLSLTFVGLLTCLVRGQNCPGTPCACIADGDGRITRIDCSNRGLTEVPVWSGMFFQGELEVVDFSGNNFVTFDPFGFGFYFIGVSSINLLDLSNNQLTSIANAFAVTDMSPQYDVLNLSSNNFEEFPSNAIPREQLSNVILTIDISNNRITSLPMNFIGDYIVVTIPTLRFDISNNMIDYIHPMAFSNSGISELYLDVRGNRLTNLSSDFYFPESNNNGFNMSDNPWNCDCNFRWVVTSYLRKVWRYSPPLCSEPSPIRDMPIFDLKPDDYVCAPVVDGAAADITVASGNNVLECPALADPQHTLGITWNFDLPCFGKPLRLSAESRVATINDVSCFPQANVSCTAFNYGGSVDINLDVISSRDVTSPCPGSRSGGRGGFVFLIVLVIISFIVLLGLAGYYWYLLREIQKNRSAESGNNATVQYSNSHVHNLTRPTRPAPAPPTHRW